jgi:hypothetical protein
LKFEKFERFEEFEEFERFERFERFEEFEVMRLSPSHLVLIAENVNLRCGSATKRIEEFEV